MGTLFVDKLDPQSGTSLELGSSGDTVSVNTGATTSLLGNVTLGASGKTITVPSGCTITNNGTQTGFGGVNAPYFFASVTTNQTINHDTTTKCSFDRADVDSASGYDTTNKRYTIPSGKTITVPSGCTITNSGTSSGFGDAGTQVAIAGRGGNQTSIADNVWTKLAYNTDVDDPGSNFDTSNNRYIAPAAGRYFFNAQAYCWGYINTINARFYKNGNAQNDTYFIDNGDYSGVREFTVRSVGIFDLAQNDYIEFWIQSNVTSGTTVADQQGTQFLAFRLD